MLKPGDKLPNGATLLLSHDIPATGCTYPAKIVLAHDGFQGYVTWLLVLPTAKPAYCIEGHYFRGDYFGAIEDFVKRTGRSRPIIPRNDQKAERDREHAAELLAWARSL